MSLVLNRAPSRLGLIAAMVLAGMKSAPSKHAGARLRISGKRPRRAKGAKRLPIARGPGSISAKADITALARSGLWYQAANMSDAHYRQCGERVGAPALWRQYAAAGVCRYD